MSTQTPQGLTSRQAEILNVIETAMAEHGYAPTMREIGAAVGLTSTASVKYQLEILEQKGFIRPDLSHSGGIAMLGHGRFDDIEDFSLAGGQALGGLCAHGYRVT